MNKLLLTTAILCLFSELAFATSIELVASNCADSSRVKIIQSRLTTKKLNFFGLNLNDSNAKFFEVTVQNSTTLQKVKIYSFAELNPGDEYRIAYSENTATLMEPILKRINPVVDVSINIWPKEYSCFLDITKIRTNEKIVETYFNKIAKDVLFAKKSIFLFEEAASQYYFLPPNTIVKSQKSVDGKILYKNHITFDQFYIDLNSTLIYPNKNYILNFFARL